MLPDRLKACPQDRAGRHIQPGAQLFQGGHGVLTDAVGLPVKAEFRDEACGLTRLPGSPAAGGGLGVQGQLHVVQKLAHRMLKRWPVVVTEMNYHSRPVSPGRWPATQKPCAPALSREDRATARHWAPKVFAHRASAPAWEVS